MKQRFTALLLGVAAIVALTEAHGQSMPAHDMMDMSKHGAMGSGMAAMPSDSTGTLGHPGDPAKVTRTIEVRMDDTMRFTPELIKVKAGETVRFFVRNAGQTEHNMIIGSLAELQAHAAMMAQMPNMQHMNMVSLKPSQRGGMVWTFDKPGSLDFACMVPGHLAAGMMGKIIIED